MVVYERASHSPPVETRRGQQIRCQVSRLGYCYDVGYVPSYNLAFVCLLRFFVFVFFCFSSPPFFSSVCFPFFFLAVKFLSGSG